jgi:hypothetical protein
VCRICGKRIHEGFQPLDAIRSSHGLQGKELKLDSTPDAPTLFASEKSGFSSTAWACTVYAMVPYLGILFIPFAIGAGTVGYIVKRQSSEAVADRRPLLAIALSLVILIVQLVLWWLLYIIPEIGI